MPWSTSDRRSRLPANWPELVTIVKRRACGRCEQVTDGSRCGDRGTDVDHIIPGDDHDLGNLQLLCRWHHKQKTAREGNQARDAAYAKLKRPELKHPGLR